MVQAGDQLPIYAPSRGRKLNQAENIMRGDCICIRRAQLKIFFDKPRWNRVSATRQLWD